jgi:cytochrome c553
MRELGLVLTGCIVFTLFFSTVIYPDIEYKGFSNSSSCTGMCYAEYVALNGTVVEIEQKKKAIAAGDPFSDIRGIWAGCSACHGPDGGGGIGPMLAGQSASMISDKLTTYKNNGTIGPMSSLMWGQAAMLSDKDISMIGDYIEAGLPGK